MLFSSIHIDISCKAASIFVSFFQTFKLVNDIAVLSLILVFTPNLQIGIVFGIYTAVSLILVDFYEFSAIFIEFFNIFDYRVHVGLNGPIDM